jgi:hypothetical protein
LKREGDSDGERQLRSAQERQEAQEKQGRQGKEVSRPLFGGPNSIRGTGSPRHQLVKPLQRSIEELEVIEINIQY